MICVKIEDGKVVEAMRSATLPEGWLKVVRASEPFTAGPDEIGITSDLTFQQITQCEQDGDLLEFVGPVAPSPEVVAEMDRVRMTAAIDAERDRRIALGFAFGGKVIQFRPEDKQRVTGAGALAGFAVASGAQPGDLRWHGGVADFEWITADNTTLALDAVGMFAMSQAAAAHESAHVFAARALKNADPIPSDFTDDSYWPVRP